MTLCKICKLVDIDEEDNKTICDKCEKQKSFQAHIGLLTTS